MDSPKEKNVKKPLTVDMARRLIGDRGLSIPEGTLCEHPKLAEIIDERAKLLKRLEDLNKKLFSDDTFKAV